MIEFYYRTTRDKKIIPLREFQKGCWINVFNPSSYDLSYLKRLGLRANVLEDALDPDELPRIEIYKGLVYVILNIPSPEKGESFLTPLLVVVAKDFFLTLSRERLGIVQKILKTRDIFTTQKVKNLLTICLEVTDIFTREVRKINKEISAKRVNLSKLDNQDIVYFVKLEEILNEFVTAIVALIGVFEKIRLGKYVRIFSEDETLLEDLITDSYQSLDMCRTSLKKIVNIREAYSTILTNNLNKVFKFLTSLTIILAVPTIIASLYGMNVPLPGQHNPLAFGTILAFTFFVCLVLVMVFYLKKWL